MKTARSTHVLSLTLFNDTKRLVKRLIRQRPGVDNISSSRVQCHIVYSDLVQRSLDVTVRLLRLSSRRTRGSEPSLMQLEASVWKTSKSEVEISDELELRGQIQTSGSIVRLPTHTAEHRTFTLTVFDLTVLYLDGFEV